MSDVVKFRLREAKARPRTILNLGGLRISDLPVDVYHLTHLNELLLWGNRLASLPAQLRDLVHLQLLDIANNRLSSLPEEIGHLSNLATLILSKNRLRSLPESISKLKNLHRLDLEENLISRLPDSFGKLEHLRTLNLKSNDLRELPDSFGELPRLQYLDLSRNEFTSLPVSLAKLKTLISIDISGNPISDDHEWAASEGGLSVLQAYLTEKARGAIPLWTAKLMIVGQGGVGKTNLLRRLRGESFIEGLEPTHNLDIRSLDLPHPEHPEVTLKLRAWDFGGQEFYHATHQFFYGGSAIFLVVWNSREDNREFREKALLSWLDRIHSLAPGAPVLLVATWADLGAPNVPFAQLKDQYPQIKGLLSVSNKVEDEWKSGIANLRQQIARIAVDSLTTLGRMFPKTWADAAASLQTSHKPVIPLHEFRRRLVSLGVHQDTVDGCIDYLNEIGEITFFRKNPLYNINTPELDELIILRPDWLLQMISRVLVCKEVQTNDGILLLDQQRQIWHDVEPYIQEHLLKLLDHFDLAYRTETVPEKCVVVELSSEDRPNTVMESWQRASEAPDANLIRLHYRLRTELPPGLPTWFIARAHRFTKPENLWRRGALFADEQRRHVGIVQADLEGKTIELSACGPFPQTFHAQLRTIFELTLKRFAGILAIRTVPCPTTGCSGDFVLEGLEKLLSSQSDSIRCSRCYEEIAVPQLLYGLKSGSGLIQDTLAELQKELGGLRRDIGDVKSMLELLQREFTDVYYREQSKVNSHCPSVFLLTMAKSSFQDASSFRRKASAAFASVSRSVELQLFCEAPGEWHPVSKGRYEIRQLPPDVARLLPVVKRVLSILNVVAPLSKLAFAGSSPEAQVVEAVSAAIVGANEFLREFGYYDAAVSTVNSKSITVTQTVRQTSGEELVALRSLLMDIAPHQKDRWGGLSKILIDKTNYCWLCQDHYSRYLKKQGVR